ncbi:MAG TPA: hypothetical protein VJ724_08955 [Tahibacter sp.]|nr:hypothetical protein [Tahibacter sp.]
MRFHVRLGNAMVACLFSTTTGFASDAPAHPTDEFALAQVIVNPEPFDNDRFGGPISLSGNRFAVGAYFNDTNDLTDSGAVYIYGHQGNQWVLEAQPVPTDPAVDDWFAIASLQGDRLAVGAPMKNQRIGAAYVFERNPANGLWVQQAKLLPETPTTGCGVLGCHLFGNSVSMDGDTVAVSAHVENEEAGAVYVFVRNAQGTWTQQARLAGGGVLADSHFGNQVALEGNTLLVGAYHQNVSSAQRGAAYVFVRDQGAWTQQAQLLASDGDADDLFGSDVALSGNTAVVGARGADLDEASKRGAAYVFVRTGAQWTLQARLDASDGVGSAPGDPFGDQFGYSVAVRGDDVWIGKFPGVGSFAAPDRIGAAYHYRRTAGIWSEVEHFTPEAGSPGDGFANALAFDDRTLLVGSIHEGTAPGEVPSRGAVYAYAKSPDDRIFADDFEP